MKTLTKTKSHAFGKNCYLLGKDKEGNYLWLEAASFDCSWYWGFGYVEVYTNQLNPAMARDISSHTHLNGLIGIKDKDDEYIHHINEILTESVFSDHESWVFSDLMTSFYTLNKCANLYYSGNSNLTVTGDFSLQDLDQNKHINESVLPKLFNEIYSILEP